MAETPGPVEVLPVHGLPELRPGDDLAGLLAAAAPWLRDGDILAVTAKAVAGRPGRRGDRRGRHAGRGGPAWFGRQPRQPAGDDRGRARRRGGRRRRPG